eukprot:scaffold1206_cov160-Amphora_coffeaeformis.AAC.6
MKKNNQTEDKHAIVPVIPRRDRIHILRDFLLDKFDVEVLRRGFVLDVAGGKGDLSFLLCNADGLPSVVVDPRCPDHDKIMRTCLWYHENKNTDKQQQQRKEGQALARLDLSPPFQIPRHLRMFFDANLLSVLKQQQPKKDDVKEETDNSSNSIEWDVYWEQTRQRVQKLESAFPPHRQKKKHKIIMTTQPQDEEEQPRNHIIESARQAWQILTDVTLVVGWHPDEATDACIDFALARRLPFVVCPCCLFSSFFPHRQWHDKEGQPRPVTNYEDYIRYLQEKHPSIRVEKLPFRSSATGHGADLARNTVLYMLVSDYDNDKDDDTTV